MEARLDKWLWAARIYKTRTLAADACKNGRVSINGAQAKPSRTVKEGDEVTVRKAPVNYTFRVKQAIENRVGAKLLPDIYENITAQMLVAQGYHLYYYTFPKENTKLHYEVDFLLPERSKIIPIEVKSSGYRTHASLDAFAQKFSSRISRRLLVYPKNLQKEHDVICLPIYLLPFLREMLHGESLQQR